LILFIDTSALVKLYIEEPGSELMREAAREAAIAVSTLTFAELHATFARRKREDLLLASEFVQLHRRLADDWEELLQVPIGTEVLTLIPGLCERYSLRGADAIQLASALLLHQGGLEITLACSDRLLFTAAVAEGLSTFDPVQMEAEAALRVVPPPPELLPGDRRP
jgi:predicted nucleic acid-binding protein